jgi:nucleoside-diphosphate-sugar epimerase
LSACRAVAPSAIRSGAEDYRGDGDCLPDHLTARAVIDVSKARKLLGWHSLAPQEEGIRRTLEWLVTVDPSRWKVK